MESIILTSLGLVESHLRNTTWISQETRSVRCITKSKRIVDFLENMKLEKQKARQLSEESTAIEKELAAFCGRIRCNVYANWPSTGTLS